MRTSPVLTPEREAIVLALREYPGMSAREVSEACAMHESTAAYHLRRLCRAGVVRRERRGRVTVHRLTGVSP